MRTRCPRARCRNRPPGLPGGGVGGILNLSGIPKWRSWVTTVKRHVDRRIAEGHQPVPGGLPGEPGESEAKRARARRGVRVLAPAALVLLALVASLVYLHYRDRARTVNTLQRVNLGCGHSPTPGWCNYDNSFSVRLAKYPLLVLALEKLRLLTEGQKSFISYARNSNIIWADATKHIPLPDNCVEALYTSHMVEHLDRNEVILFLREARRLLAPHGVLRIGVPDLRKLVSQYVTEGDADSFLEATLLTREMPKTILGRLQYLAIGDRHHLWMYDGPSMIRLLSTTGFKEPRILEPGLTTIPNPGELNLYERAEESVYVEAYR